MRVVRWALGLLAAIAVATALGACGSSDGGSTASASSKDSPGSITVGIPVDDASYGPLYLAVDKDLFAKHNLKVKLVVFQGGSDLAKAVVGGSVDVAVSALSEMLPAVEQHQPLKAFYGGYNSAPFIWYGQKGITSIQDVKGKKIGVTRVGSSTDFITRYLLSKDGLNPETDAQIIGVGGGPAQVAAMKANQVDATVSSPVTSYQLEADGDPVLARQTDLSKEYPTHVAYANESFLTDHKADAQHFLEGMVDGMKMAKSDPKATAQAIADHQKVDLPLAERAYKDNVDFWYPDGRLPSADDMQVFWQIGIENGAWPKEMPESQWLDRQFMDSYPQWGGGGA
jgi:ABC-type nitrate/sulfonate/bicarbonate transport system substrate-binding protein